MSPAPSKNLGFYEFLGASYKLNHIVYVFLWVVCFTLYNAAQIVHEL